jgi:hypothetical protein
MPRWNTTDRGVNREAEANFHDKKDYDGKSCMDHHRLPGRGISDVESLTMLSGLEGLQNSH